MEEKELIIKAQNGDRNALAKLVKQYEQTVYNFAFKICRDKDRAEHTMQETFLSMVKSIKQFSEAGRDELVAVEEAEIEIIQTYLPEALSEEEITQIIKDAIAESGAASMKEMGKVMGIVKPKVQGRADMGSISGVIKGLLG